MKLFRFLFFFVSLIIGLAVSANAQVVAGDSVMQHVTGSRLSIGGYGEIGYSRNFYSDHVSRYSQPEEHKNDPSHGRFDLPHAVIYIGYDFGKGWSFGTEIEFEQFWIQKSFAPWANLRMGHIVVPVGLNNAYHEPLNFFTVYRPEGEDIILPSTWHQTGFSFWGRYGDWRYEAQFLAGLNADHFTNTGWIHKGPKSPLEFDVANKYGGSLRIDNYSIPGLRIGVSAYYGHSIGNTYPAEKDGASATYKGKVVIGSIDFTYNDHNWVVRGQADYGHLSDAAQLKYMYNRMNSKSPYKHSAFVSGNAYAIGVEAGYDIFSQIEKLRADRQKLYIFGRYEQYNPYASNTNNTPYDYTAVKRMAFGLNYLPIKQIVVKAEYSHRFLKKLYNDEPSVSIGVAYEGWFDLGQKRVSYNDTDVKRLNERINDLQRQLDEVKKNM